MSWCVICRAEYDAGNGAPCPRCGTGAQASDSSSDKPAHLSVLDASPQRPSSSPRSAKRRLVSSAGPSVPVRKQANDSVPSSWMARLEAARTTAQPTGPGVAPREETPSGPPPLKPAQEKKAEAPVGKPAHLLIAQLEADEEKRTKAEAQRAAQLFAEDRSDEIAKVEIALDESKIRKKKVPDWVVALVLAVVVLGAAAVIVLRVRKEEGPKATIDPAVAAQIERKKQAVAALEEGHRLALEQKPDDAIKSYSKALELDPMMAAAERGLAIAYAAKDDDANALDRYKSYLKLAPNASDAEDVRAIVEKYEQKKKQAAEAAAAAEKARAEEKKPKRNGKKRPR